MIMHNLLRMKIEYFRSKLIMKKLVLKRLTSKMLTNAHQDWQLIPDYI